MDCSGFTTARFGTQLVGRHEPPVGANRFYRSKELLVQPIENMVVISPGSFVMGSPDTEAGRSTNEGPQTTVTLTKGFYIGKYEVTQTEFLEVMGFNPSFVKGDEAPNRPVETVTWNNAVSYCEALTERERAAGQIPSTWSYRLPTEAEWEYCCRAGTATAYSFGDDSGLLAAHGWYDANAGHPTDDGFPTRPVGEKDPNPWGLHDMHGNVYEYCQDSWDKTSNYLGGNVIDPLVTTGFARIVRGGGAVYPASFARSAHRNGNFPDSGQAVHYGFKVVLAPSR